MGPRAARQRVFKRYQANKNSDLSSVALVGGGVGIPPLYHFAQYFLKSGFISKKNICVFLGARRRSLLLCEKDFEKLDVDVKISTDDGSKGRKGFVTELLEDFLKDRGTPATRIFTCGPTPMLKAVSIVSQKYEVPCEVSVEVPMACGFGACLGCAIEIDDLKGRRFAMACTEGPVFQAKEVIW